MSSSNSPCAACKFLRRKCTQECVFAPYFPPDNPQRFAYVHKVFGASNVAKLLNELSAAQRDDAVKSLAYEAEARLRDPVYGCVGLISVLQHKLRLIQGELSNAKKELANYIGPQAQGITAPMLQQHPNNPFPCAMYGNMPTATAAVHGGQLVIRDAQPASHHHHHHQQILEAQQLAAAVAVREQQEMFRSYEQQQQQEFLRFSGGFDVGSASSAVGFSQVPPAAGSADQLSPSLALGSFDNAYNMQQQPQQGEPHHHHPHHISLEAQLLLSSQQKQQTHHESQLPLHRQHSESEECRSVGPSC